MKTILTTTDQSIAENDILAWLEAHPDFLIRYPHMCDILLPPTEKKGKGVADFQQYLVQRLRADNNQVKEKTRTLLETARHNMNNQQRIHGAVLRVLEAHSFEEFIQVLTSDLATMLDIDITALVVEADGQKIPHIHTSGIRIVPEGTIDKWMDGKNALLQDNIHGIEPIFGGGATLVRSQALMRVDISINTPPAILAFGSRDPGMFVDGQATDQVSFLARVVERTFRMWLELP